MKKRFKTQEIYAPPDVKIPRRLGGGILKERVIRELPSKRVVSYALAYINPIIFSGDNGRVLGYDNSHDYSHRHYLGIDTTWAASLPIPLRAMKICTKNSSVSGNPSPSNLLTENRCEKKKNQHH